MRITTPMHSLTMLTSMEKHQFALNRSDETAQTGFDAAQRSGFWQVPLQSGPGGLSATAQYAAIEGSPSHADSIAGIDVYI